MLASCFCHLYIHKQTCHTFFVLIAQSLGHREADSCLLGFIQVVTNLSGLPQPNFWMFTEWWEKMDQETTHFKMALCDGVAARCLAHHSTITLPLHLSLLSSTGGEIRMKISWAEICMWKHNPPADWSKCLDTVRTHIASVSQRHSVGYYNYYMGLLFPIGWKQALTEYGEVRCSVIVQPTCGVFKIWCGILVLTVQWILHTISWSWKACSIISSLLPWSLLLDIQLRNVALGPFHIPLNNKELVSWSVVSGMKIVIIPHVLCDGLLCPQLVLSL